MIIFQKQLNIQKDYLLPKIHHETLPFRKEIVENDLNIGS